MGYSTAAVVRRCGFAAVVWCGAAIAEPAYDHHVKLTPENSAIGNFPAQKQPILTIRSGDTVKFDTGGGAGWQRAEIDPDAWLEEHGVPITADAAPVRETIEVLAKTQRYAGHRERASARRSRRDRRRDAGRFDRSARPSQWSPAFPTARRAARRAAA